MTPVKQGSVYNNYSNLVLVVAVDGAAIRAWKGYEHPGYEELSERLFDGDDVTVELEDRTGVLFDMGGCGSSKVFRLADDDIALVEHYSADWNPDIEAQFLAAVGAGVAEDAHPIGSVEVTSGVLALLHAGDPGEGDVAAPAVGAVTKLECHLLLGVPNGRYVLLGERLEAKGGWGKIETRVRIVREESIARAREGAPVAPAVERALPACVKHAGRMELPDGMDFVASLALADTPWLVAGQKSGPMIAVWSAASGELAWSAALADQATANEYTQNVMVSIHGDRIAAAVGEQLVILDLESGDELARHALGPGKTPFARMIGSSSSFARFAPDGGHVFVGQLPTVRVLDAETGTERARIEGCSGTYDAPASPDGSIIALPGVELRLVDPRTFAVTRTIPLPGYASAAAFSPAGDVLAIASGGVVTFYDVATGAAGASLPAASTVTEISVGAIAWSSAGLVATASEDGYVRLWRADTRELVGELPGHDTTTPGTGARSLHGLAFSPKGDVLFVGGGPPGEHALAAYLLA